MTFKAEPNVHIAHVGTNILKINRNVRMSNDITNCINISFFSFIDFFLLNILLKQKIPLQFNDHFDKSF
jgi:hypothetical protein